MFEPARQIFISRSLRLSFFTTLCLAVNFFLALAAPLWMLAVGPLVFGVMHLISSVRHVPKAILNNKTEQASVSKCIAVFVLGVAFLRLMPVGSLTWAHSWDRTGLADHWEWLALAATFLVILVAVKRQLTAGAVVSAMLLVPLLYCSWHFPLATAASLLIGHNFVPFFYWIKMAKNSSERKTALLSLSAFTLIHVVILLGLTDSLAHRIQLPFPSLGGSLDPMLLAHQVFPAATDFQLLERAISIFAFGQAVHYFLWIKVIPEQALEQEVPLSFQRSWRELIADLGRPLSSLALLTAVGFVVLAMFFELGPLRDFYVLGVTAHGYAELAGLPFLLLRTT